jgi:hypothetical protein
VLGVCVARIADWCIACDTCRLDTCSHTYAAARSLPPPPPAPAVSSSCARLPHTQCVSLLGLLAQHMQQRGPFLVVVPLSVVPNWAREFRKWLPQVRAMSNAGGGESSALHTRFLSCSLYPNPAATAALRTTAQRGRVRG